ncbi:MAG: transglycosylase SLT domain-containing protein [Vicinamibacteria bacterium]
MRRALLFAALSLLPTSAAAQKSERYDNTFRKYSKRFFGAGFDWKVFKAQAIVESNLNPEARSFVGAVGLMQLMPSTFGAVQTKNPELQSIDDPEWNIAAGIQYDRQLWSSWSDHESAPDRIRFTLGAYNAGRVTLLRAQDKARAERLDENAWSSIEIVAPKVPRWRHGETLSYVRRIDESFSRISTAEGLNGLLGW